MVGSEGDITHTVCCFNNHWVVTSAITGVSTSSIVLTKPAQLVWKKGLFLVYDCWLNVYFCLIYR